MNYAREYVCLEDGLIGSLNVGLSIKIAIAGREASSMLTRIQPKTLSELFPLDRPESQYMFQLSVVREDLVFEFLNLNAERDGDYRDRGDVTGTVTYFVRKITVSIFSLHEILTANRKDFQQWFQDRKQLQDERKKLLALIDTNSSLLRPYRNYTGAHSDLKNGVWSDTVTRFPGLSGMMQRSNYPLETFYRLPWFAAMLATMDTDESEGVSGFEREAARAAEPIREIAKVAIYFSDAVLSTYWGELRVYK